MNKKSGHARNNKVKENLEEKLANLKQGKGRKYFITHVDYPQKQKERDKNTIINIVRLIENNLPRLKNLIKEGRSYFNEIWDKDKYVAAYLLLGKALSNLEAGIYLSKLGYNEEILEISRSGHESIDLGLLFLDDENSDLLQKWFKGEIIPNAISRKYFEKRMNKILDGGVRVSDVKADIYHAYSLSTHSQYTALVDSIDVFYEDLDYQKYAGYHHTVSIVYYLESLYCNILFLLKEIFNLKLDILNFEKSNDLLKGILHETSLSEEKEVLRKYRRKTKRTEEDL